MLIFQVENETKPIIIAFKTEQTKGFDTNENLGTVVYAAKLTGAYANDYSNMTKNIDTGKALLEEKLESVNVPNAKEEATKFRTSEQDSFLSQFS